ncbi:hypothetical protein GCM10023115_05220 [Pontixanthobacter gangjinensis]|nr:M48 family metalloprotease [Pontixanthobacter gangjinensis]
MRRLAMALLLAVSGVAWVPSASASDNNATKAADAPADEFAVQFGKLRAQDDYLQKIGWRLRTGNAAFCSRPPADIGLMLQDAAAYPDISAVRRVNAVNGDFFVHSVVPGSPAELAGLKPAMEVVSVGSTELASLDVDAKEKWRRLETVNAMIRSELAETGTVYVTVSHLQKPVEIRGIAACPGRFELITGLGTASANRERVAIGSDFVGLSYPEEEFAAVLAHELAHILLQHPDWLDANGRGRQNVRNTEREADQLMPWLLANAGYDPAAAVRFMKRWGPKHSGGLFRKRTHDGWDERAETIEQQLPLIKAATNDQGQADWR